MAVVYVPNPKAHQVEIGQIVTSSYSGRKVVVAKKGKYGDVFEKITNSEEFRFIGSAYKEFEPAFIKGEI